MLLRVIQMYMTSALSKNDMKGVALQLAMEMMHKKGAKDVVTGLKTRTQPGRPDWAQVITAQWYTAMKNNLAVK